MQRFTANAAHEIQTPLTVLRGHLEVSLRRDRTPEICSSLKADEFGMG